VDKQKCADRGTASAKTITPTISNVSLSSCPEGTKKGSKQVTATPSSEQVNFFGAEDPHRQNASPRLSECADSISAHRTLLRVCVARRQVPSAQLTPTLQPRASPVNIDQTVSDFDGVTFHISTPETKSKILVSINVRCFQELLKYGAQQVLEREYGPYVVAPESGYDFSVLIDLENLPEERGGHCLCCVP